MGNKASNESAQIKAKKEDVEFLFGPDATKKKKSVGCFSKKLPKNEAVTSITIPVRFDTANSMNDPGITSTENNNPFHSSSILNEQQKIALLKLISNFKFCFKVYDSTKDGIRPSDFHMKCDGIEGTLIVIKSGDQIAGAYTYQDWSGNFVQKFSKDAFFFSLNKNKKYYIKDKNFFIFCNPQQHPNFGRLLIRL